MKNCSVCNLAFTVAYITLLQHSVNQEVFGSVHRRIFFAKKCLWRIFVHAYVNWCTENQSDSDSDGCEDWERHEALHNDVTSQERTKERLFEEEIELKWEKGGSGLVFYTGAYLHLR